MVKSIPQSQPNQPEILKNKIAETSWSLFVTKESETSLFFPQL